MRFIAALFALLCCSDAMAEQPVHFDRDHFSQYIGEYAVLANRPHKAQIGYVHETVTRSYREEDEKHRRCIRIGIDIIPQLKPHETGSVLFVLPYNIWKLKKGYSLWPVDGIGLPFGGRFFSYRSWENQAQFPGQPTKTGTYKDRTKSCNLLSVDDWTQMDIHNLFKYPTEELNEMEKNQQLDWNVSGRNIVLTVRDFPIQGVEITIVPDDQSIDLKPLIDELKEMPVTFKSVRFNPSEMDIEIEDE